MATATLAPRARIKGADRDKVAKRYVARYRKGESIRSIAEESGRSYGFVHRILNEAEVTLRSRGGATRGKTAEK